MVCSATCISIQDSRSYYTLTIGILWITKLHKTGVKEVVNKNKEGKERILARNNIDQDGKKGQKILYRVIK